MRSGFVATLLVMLLFIPCTAVAILSDSSDAAVTTYTVEGYIGEDTVDGIKAAQYVSVSVTPGGASAYTDARGKFSISVDVESGQENSLGLYINKPGYTIRFHPDCITPNDSGNHTLDLSKLPSGSTKTLSSNLNSGIILAPDYVSAKIKVIGTSEKPLEGATIAIYGENESKVFSGSTDQEGICSINSILAGTYTVVVKHSGCYDKTEEGVNISKLTTAAIPITMDQKEIPTIGGLTTYHIMMSVGVSVGIALVLASYILCKRNWKNVDSSED